MPRITAPVTTVYLAGQLDIVLAFVDHFFVRTTPPHRVTRIRVLLKSCIEALGEPDKFPHNDMLNFLKDFLRQIQAIDEHNPSLQNTPAYPHEYQRILEILTHVIHLGQMHNLLTQLEDT